MDTLEEAELIASIRHIAKFLKSGISIYNSGVPDKLVAKWEEEEQRQLQNVLRFT